MGEASEIYKPGHLASRNPITILRTMASTQQTTNASSDTAPKHHHGGREAAVGAVIGGGGAHELNKGTLIATSRRIVAHECQRQSGSPSPYRS
jgi:hypothetical protein